MQALWDWIILFLVIYTAVFTPYVAAFLLNEQDYQQASNNQNYKDPIFVIDLLGEQSGKSIAMQIGNKFEKGGAGQGAPIKGKGLLPFRAFQVGSLA